MIVMKCSNVMYLELLRQGRGSTTKRQGDIVDRLCEFDPSCTGPNERKNLVVLSNISPR